MTFIGTLLEKKKDLPLFPLSLMKFDPLGWTTVDKELIQDMYKNMGKYEKMYKSLVYPPEKEKEMDEDEKNWNW
jgi:hypothetical protein